MGWSSGSRLLSEVWETVREYVPEDNRSGVLADMMDIFAGDDCDTLDEVIRAEWPESQEAYDMWLQSETGEELHKEFPGQHTVEGREIIDQAKASVELKQEDAK